MNELKDFHLPRWNELPEFPLYIDQVIAFLENKLSILQFDQEVLITKSMINNYVKNGLVSAPKNKKYERVHLAYFVVVVILKRSFSLEEISQLIQFQIQDFPLESSYDYFCTEIEACVKGIINREPVKHTPSLSKKKELVNLIQSTCMCVTQKISVQYRIMILNQEENKDLES